MLNHSMLHLLSLSVGMSYSYAIDSTDPHPLLPPTITIGMNSTALRELTRDAVQQENLNGAMNSPGNYNLIERSGRGTICWYYIRDYKLSGYLRTTKLSAVSADQERIERELILPGNGSEYILDSEVEALRFGRDSKPKTVKVKKWKGDSSDVELYTLVSTEEITGVMFDTKELNKSQFFVDPEMAEQINEQIESVSKQVGAVNFEHIVSGKRGTSKPEEVKIDRESLNASLATADSTKVATNQAEQLYPILLIVITTLTVICAILFFQWRRGKSTTHL